MLPLMATLLLAGMSMPARAEVSAPGGAVAVEHPQVLRRWFTALRKAATGQGVARALHYGDSTIASDGLARTVRARLVARFGDAGPGYVSAGFTPTWNERSDVASTRGGDWSYRTLLFGGAQGRYGLGGIVGLVRSGASVRLHAVGADGQPVAQRHLELWYQAGQGYGALQVAIDGAQRPREEAAADHTQARRSVWDAPTPFTEVRLTATGGTVPLYGVVLETGAPGATWESLGVTGVGSKSFTTWAGPELAEELALRDPDLLVVQLGGNEAGFPVLTVGDGAGYRPIFGDALRLLRQGAPDAACLVLSPLDQGERDADTGVARSRRGMPNLVAQQRAEALDQGCAFWSSWQAMGGEGASVSWASRRGLSAGDLVHLSPGGLAILGDRLADALLAAFDADPG